jgi:hypothetical protein
MRKMKRFLAALALATLLPLAAKAQDDADLQRADLVATCLVNVAGAEENALFHNLLLAVVNEDAAGAQTFISAIVARTRDVAIASCNQEETWFVATWAGTALGSYIQRMLAAQFSEGLAWLQAL